MDQYVKNGDLFGFTLVAQTTPLSAEQIERMFEAAALEKHNTNFLGFLFKSEAVRTHEAFAPIAEKQFLKYCEKNHDNAIVLMAPHMSDVARLQGIVRYVLHTPALDADVALKKLNFPKGLGTPAKTAPKTPSVLKTLAEGFGSVEVLEEGLRIFRLHLEAFGDHERLGASTERTEQLAQVCQWMEHALLTQSTHALGTAKTKIGPHRKI